MLDKTPQLSEQLLALGASKVETIEETWPTNYNDAIRELLIYLFANSDFIFDNAKRHEFIFKALIEQKDDKLELAIPSYPLQEQEFLKLDEVTFKQSLRLHRQHLMTVIAARNFLNIDDITETMRLISASADVFYLIARSWATEQLKPRWGQALRPDGEPCQLIALGMGKLGGFELNFSSDIDLIFCYSSKGTTQGGRKSEDHQSYFTKLAQKIIHLLDSSTVDGRVFRVDMRLRPFGDSGPLVSNFDAIEDYYQDQGRDWERYALLKARPLGLHGQISQTEVEDQQALISLLRPFVYRRYIDFSVIQSLRNMKLMIKQEVKRRQLTNNIKLGEGGIREVEFVVQALQMLRGGKETQLQTPSLLKVLPELVELSAITTEEQKLLTEQYFWLRRCEQYLQAFHDKQTQTLPEDPINQARLQHLFQMGSWQAFLALNQQVQQQVHQLFNQIIGDEPDDKKQPRDSNTIHWQQVWMVDAEDENYQPHVMQAKSSLHKRVSGSRGLESLDQLMPLLLAECHAQRASSQALNEILALIKRIASRSTYLELLVENDGAREQLVKLVSSCRFIGQQLSKFPLLLDQLIDPKLLYRVPEISSYKTELRRHLLRVEPDDLELQMEVLRQFKLSSQLIIAACDVANVISLMQVSDHLTALAEACLEQGVNLAWQQMVNRFGYPDGASDEQKNIGVIGYGKLGGLELGYGSDLDIVFVHGCNSSKETDGKKPIDSRQFYIKLVQRVMHLFTTRTLSGELYEIDTRLRPSGASGLLAINIKTFEQYQQEEAWTWEHQALVRSRFVVGDDHLKQDFDQIRQHILAQPRDIAALTKDVSDMRRKMFDHLAKESDGQFDLKQSRGGIADIEFISQFLVLAHAQQHSELTVYPDNVRIVEAAQQAGLLNEQQVKIVIDAYLKYRDFYHIASLNDESKSIATAEILEHIEQVKDVWQGLNLS